MSRIRVWCYGLALIVMAACGGGGTPAPGVGADTTSPTGPAPGAGDTSPDSPPSDDTGAAPTSYSNGWRLKREVMTTYGVDPTDVDRVVTEFAYKSNALELNGGESGIVFDVQSGRIVSHAVPQSGDLGLPPIATWDHNLAGQITSLQYGEVSCGNDMREWEYTTDGVLFRRTDHCGSSFTRAEFEYTAVGHLKGARLFMSEPDTGVIEDVVNSVEFSTDSNGLVIEVRFINLGVVIWRTTYLYDTNGNPERTETYFGPDLYSVLVHEYEPADGEFAFNLGLLHLQYRPDVTRVWSVTQTLGVGFVGL